MKTDKSKNLQKSKKKSVQNAIRHYGAPILKSEPFHRAASETHHLHGTVSGHTLAVCKASVVMARILKTAGIRVNEKDLVEASLCHDLGMIGRDEKFDNRTAAWKSHPEESVKIARELVPDLSSNAESMIRSHMWPVAGPAPRSREAVILNIADKVGSLDDWRRILLDRISPKKPVHHSIPEKDLSDNKQVNKPAHGSGHDNDK